MKPVPRALVEHIQRVAPAGAEVVPLEFSGGHPAHRQLTNS